MKGKFAKLMGCIITVLAVVWAAPVGAADEITVDPWFVEQMDNSEAILEPGTTTYCNKDIEVQNMGKDMAEVFIIRGNGDNYDRDMIPSGGTLGYKLQDRSLFATGASKGNWVSDARIVNSTLGDSQLKVICK